MNVDSISLPFMRADDPIEELEVGDDGGEGLDVVVWSRPGHTHPEICQVTWRRVSSSSGVGMET